MKSGTPGPQFHNDFGDSFMKLGPPRTRSARAGLWATQLPSNYSTAVKRVIQSLLHKRMACPSPLIYQSSSDGYFKIVEICSSDNELVDAENHKNETVRFTFSQIHQYLWFSKSLTNKLCKRDTSSLRALMAVSTRARGALNKVVEIKGRPHCIDSWISTLHINSTGQWACCCSAILL